MNCATLSDVVNSQSPSMPKKAFVGTSVELLGEDCILVNDVFLGIRMALNRIVEGCETRYYAQLNYLNGRIAYIDIVEIDSELEMFHMTTDSRMEERLIEKYLPLFTINNGNW